MQAMKKKHKGSTTQQLKPRRWQRAGVPKLRRKGSVPLKKKLRRDIKTEPRTK